MAEPRQFFNGRVTLYPGDCMDILPMLPENSVDAVCTDPPYHLTSIVKRFGADRSAPARSNGATGVYARASAGFMGQRWDGGDIAFQPETWAAVLRVLKPGGHMLAFAAPKNQHRMFCAIEDAGFEIRDCLQWIYGSGFPKSMDVSKAIDKAAGAEREVIGRDPFYSPGRRQTIGNGEKYGRGKTEAESAWITAPATNAARQWAGWGTALKPSHEPICLARKPLSEPTVAGNVLRWGTGALNIDKCRVPTAHGDKGEWPITKRRHDDVTWTVQPVPTDQSVGRWPANIILDGSEEVVSAFPETGVSAGGGMKDLRKGKLFNGETNPNITDRCGFGDSGSASRFFYTAKADTDDRAGSRHPTVKPLDLIQYLCRLVTPPKGVILDPFAGTGTTGEAAWREGFSAILIEREAEYVADIARRMEWALMGPNERSRAQAKRNGPVDAGPLFAEVANG